MNLSLAFTLGWVCCAGGMVLGYVVECLWRRYGWAWKRTFVRTGEAPYMHRYQLLVLGDWLRIYVNHILTRDHDTRHHTHPYRACWSVKLRGAYVETIPTSCPGLDLVQIPPRFSRVPFAHTIIRLLRPEGVWTLFIGWRRDQPWGFINSDGSLDPRD